MRHHGATLATTIWTILLLGWTARPSQAKANKAANAILLSNVKTLTLYGDKQTSHRRVSPIPQLSCVGGAGCKHHDVDLMRCTNAGSEYDAEDVQWTCSASLPPEFKLGSTEVVCEGYDNADDPWVLKGSCGVEYRLLLTDEGERKHGGKSARRPKRDERRDDGSDGTTVRVARFLFWLCFAGIACIILYRIFSPANPDGQARLHGNNRPGWGGGGGGGGGGDNGFDDPPPPYSPHPPTQPRAKPSHAGSSRAASGSSGPGFWTGAATGGAAGYGAGYWHGSRTAEAERRQRDRDRERSRERERERSRERARERERASGSSWFGSGRSGGGGGSYSSFGSGGGGSSSSPSSSRHESTGFGGTRRR